MAKKAEVLLKNVEIRGDNATHGYDVTAHFVIQSDLGTLNLAVPVDGASTLDRALPEARERIAKWAAAVASAAREG